MFDLSFKDLRVLMKHEFGDNLNLSINIMEMDNFYAYIDGDLSF